jgi:hypothetical protein
MLWLPSDSAGSPATPRRALAGRVLPGLRRLAVLAAGFLALGSCGGSGPTDPGGGSTGPKPGGTISGRYTLQLVPAASCNGRTVSFTVQVMQTASSPHPGAQLLWTGTEPALLELELKYTDNTLEGGVGTTGDGLPATEGPYVWVNAIASGKTTQTSDGRGEVVSGTLRGYLEIDGVMNACTSPSHAFTLRAL